MILTSVVISLAVLTAVGVPQNRGNIIFFPDEEISATEENGDGIDEYYNYPDDHSSNDTTDLYYDYDDELYDDLESFASEEDYVKLPEWMDTDFNELPLDKLKLLNNATDLTDLAGFFGLDDDDAAKLSESYNRTQPELGNDLRNADFVEKKDENAKFASCSPEMVTVELPVKKKNRYLPSCVRLKRCGGCCNNDALISCQPTKVEIVSLKVMKISKGKKSRRRMRRGTSGRVVSMQEENHVGCSCQCKVKEHHCDAILHNYNMDACTCDCKDEAKQRRCEESSSLHRWDNKSCSCTCKKKKKCSTGEVFSQSTCRCAVAA